MGTEAIVIQNGAAVQQAAANPWRDKLDLIKRTVAKDTTDEELQLFLYTAQRHGLDPLLKQIHAVCRWNKKQGRKVMTIQTGIDGYRLIAERTGKYAGSDDPVFDNEEKPGRATVTVWKIVEGQRCPFSATARWAEYFPGDEQGFMWLKMPHVMLGKCAEALALRKAFPAELSGVYTFDEMAQADSNIPESSPETVNAETSQESSPEHTPHEAVESQPSGKPRTYKQTCIWEQDRLMCNVHSVSEMTGQYGPYLMVNFHDQGQEQSIACFDKKLYADVRACAQHRGVFRWKLVGKYKRIIEVIDRQPMQVSE